MIEPMPHAKKVRRMTDGRRRYGMVVPPYTEEAA
jgi:hypothetical protein